MIFLIGQGKFDYGEFENRGLDTIGSILGFFGTGPKNLKKYQIHYFVISLRTCQIDYEESENRGPETLGSNLSTAGLKAP